MIQLVKDQTDRNLGRKIQRCRICQMEGGYTTYLVREMMLGLKEEFEYFVCDHCGCLQIAYIPDDMGKYYQKDYYSFQVQDGVDESYIFLNPATNHQRILDVGCGSGARLLKLAKMGYDKLFGCDPFIDEDIRYGDRVHIQKSTIHMVKDIEGFDRIIMTDSFEHVTDPLEVLQSAHRLLKKDGILQIEIPTFPNIAFEMFGPHWFQLDAPRHITLHSIKSIKILAQKSGFRIAELNYDATDLQIIKSFFYQHGVTFYQITEKLRDQYFSEEMLKEISSVTKKSNIDGTSDHMRVFLVKE